MKKLFKLLGWVAGIAALLAVVTVLVLKNTFLKSFPELESDPEVGK